LVVEDYAGESFVDNDELRGTSMKDIKSFVVRPDTHRALVQSYMIFPEITEVFLNITRDLPLVKNVLSSWDKEMLDGHINQFMAPQLVEAGVIAKDASKKCGYRTDFSELSFQGLSQAQMAQISAQRAKTISESFSEFDVREEVLSANLDFHAMPDALRAELLGSLRAVLTKYLDQVPDIEATGRHFRLALVARTEK
jgi:hypothetical protein